MIKLLVRLLQQCSYSTNNNKSCYTKDDGFGHISMHIDTIAFMAYS
ncbi:hypothetical protein PY091_15105 [Muricauda sp. 81s02]|uniref:Uncharacterized protein n=1 Tax=Flagellimonas okinawensis TaxID=3031324 RepID=A0ABT5XRW6_9FLAO|nr:hypothetical protein [[Muricauda] okinawensis]